MNPLRRFAQDVGGATAIEYALIASLITIVIVGALQLLGTQIGTVFNGVGSTLN